MIFIVLALYITTQLLVRPKLKLSVKESSIMLVIFICVGVIVRTILYIFGMLS